MGSGVQNREVPEVEVRDREAEQEAGEEEGGTRGGGQPRQEQEEEAGGCKLLLAICDWSVRIRVLIQSK